MGRVRWWGKQFGSDSGLRPDWLDSLTLAIFDHQNPATPPVFLSPFSCSSLPPSHCSGSPIV